MFGEAYNWDLTTAHMTKDQPDPDQYTVSLPHNSTTSTADTNATESDGDPGSNLDEYLWVYLSPVIFVIGVVGNILTIAVLRRKKFIGTTTAVYLPLVAAADTAVLITGIIPEWLEYSGILVFKELHPWTCKLEKFLFYTAGDTAIWILVAFTFDRFIAVCFPLHKTRVCQPKRAVIVCIIIFFLSICKNVSVFWTRGPEYSEDGELKKVCGRPEPYNYFEVYVRPWLAFGVIMLVPFLVIIMCNILIIRTLLRVQRMRNEQTSSDKGFLQTTTMCMSASFAFLVFIAPSLVLLIGSPYWSNEDNSNDSYNMAKAINNQLVYVNHSINFFLYCLTGGKFRQELVALCCCCAGGDTTNPYLSYFNKSYQPKTRLISQNSAQTASTAAGNGSNVHTPVLRDINSRSSCRTSPRRSPLKASKSREGSRC